MGLIEWFKSQPRGERGKIQEKLALELGVHPTTAKSYTTGARVLPSPFFVPVIEFTDKKVTAKSLANEAKAVSSSLKAQFKNGRKAA